VRAFARHSTNEQGEGCRSSWAEAAICCNEHYGNIVSESPVPEVTAVIFWRTRAKET
jgi:hypothetical protein